MSGNWIRLNTVAGSSLLINPDNIEYVESYSGSEYIRIGFTSSAVKDVTVNAWNRRELIQFGSDMMNVRNANRG